MTTCLNCKRENISEDDPRHAAPCQHCGSDGHAACQHKGPTPATRRA